MDPQVQEHIKWMEEHEATFEDTAEHFGLTQQQFLRELILADYKGEVKRRQDTSTLRFYRPFMYSRY